jgi:hypothetical protein
MHTRLFVGMFLGGGCHCRYRVLNARNVAWLEKCSLIQAIFVDVTTKILSGKPNAHVRTLEFPVIHILQDNAYQGESGRTRR